jgi:hemolysin activation/secretion protein
MSANVPKSIWTLGLALLAMRGLGQPALPEAAAPAAFFIQEYLVEGVSRLPEIAVEKAVYPFLGPGRTASDVESARAAVEEAYHARGYQTVAVSVPVQTIGRTVRLSVTEVPVGRLRVRGAAYSSPSRIKAMAPSLAEGQVVDFNQVPRDMVALNSLTERKVTPSVRNGVVSGTVDVDLEVKEQSPLHGSADLNNRHSAGTTPLRLTVAVSDNNLGQSGNAAGLSFQSSPQDLQQVKVFSAYYIARFPRLDGFAVQLQGSKQDSNVSTLGDVAVTGRGDTVGLRANFTLPSRADFFQSASAGLDYKHFNQAVSLPATATAASTTLFTPITYYPLSANYSGTWLSGENTTEFGAGLTFNVRGLGGNYGQFQNNRYGADGNFLVGRAELSHQHRLPAGFQLFAKVQGQISDQPLVSNEQFTGGGIGTARGYLEAEGVGDRGFFGTFEVRSPPLLKLVSGVNGDWRFFAFYDAGRLTIERPLPDQTSRVDFASYGIGTRIQILDHFDGSVMAAFPQTAVGQSAAHSMRTLFRAGLNF